MRYTEFRDLIQEKLQRNAEGLTWFELKESLGLPYQRPCPEWIKRLEQEIGLCRAKGACRAYVWTVEKATA